MQRFKKRRKPASNATVIPSTYLCLVRFASSDITRR
jgi:hypothetical protein